MRSAFRRVSDHSQKSMQVNNKEDPRGQGTKPEGARQTADEAIMKQWFCERLLPASEQKELELLYPRRVFLFEAAGNRSEPGQATAHRSRALRI